MSKIEGYTDEELAGLSEEEIAALTDADDVDVETLKIVAGDDDAGDDTAAAAKAKADAAAATNKDEDEDETDPVAIAAAADAKAAAKVAADAAAAEAAAAEANAASEAETDPADQVRYNVAPVEKYDEQMAQIAADLAEATAQFKASDLEVEDFLAKQSELNAKRETLQAANLKSDLSREFNEQQAQREWQRDISYFKRDIKRDEEIDYDTGVITVAGAEVKLIDELDKTVKLLGNDPDNAKRTGEWFLKEAHEIIKARYKVGPAAAPAADVGSKPPSRKPDLKAVPRTTGGLPAAAESDAGGDPEFSHLEKLDGLALENAVAAMTPEKQARWEAAG